MTSADSVVARRSSKNLFSSDEASRNNKLIPVQLIIQLSPLLEDGINLSVLRQATGWTAGVRIPAGERFSLLHNV
jgi:hypothetical protein